MEKKTFETKLKSLKQVAKGTFEVTVEKPKGFAFTAGQYSALFLVNPKSQDPRGNDREFSIASSPHEKDIRFVFRETPSIFKQQLLQLKPGDAVRIQEPSGLFVLPESADREVVFLVGGVGATAVRSILNHAHANELPHKITMLYSNRTPEETVFIDELRELSKKYKIVLTMTGIEGSSSKWDEEVSRIDKNFILKHIPDYADKLFYIIGPLSFTSAMVKMTRELSIPFSQVKLESYGLYGRGI